MKEIKQTAGKIAAPRKSTQKKSVGRPKEFERELALEKALQVFWEKGYVLASMNTLLEGLSIQAKSGISAASLQNIPQLAVQMLIHQ